MSCTLSSRNSRNLSSSLSTKPMLILTPTTKTKIWTSWLSKKCAHRTILDRRVLVCTLLRAPWMVGCSCNKGFAPGGICRVDCTSSFGHRRTCVTVIYDRLGVKVSPYHVVALFVCLTVLSRCLFDAGFWGHCLSAYSITRFYTITKTYRSR